MADHYLTIPMCPKCARQHRYRLDVERSIVVKMATAFDPVVDDEPRRRVELTRFFTCPEKNEEFQATFSLTDIPSMRIAKVTVKGIANAADE